MRVRYHAVRFLELAVTFASCHLAVGSFFHSSVYALIKRLVADLLASVDVSYALAGVDPDVVLPQLISVLVFLIALYHWLFESRENVLSIYVFNMALFLPEALTFSRLNWSRLLGAPEVSPTGRGFPEVLITGLVIVAGYVVLYVNGRFLETRAAMGRRGALREEADLIFVNQSTISFLVIVASLVVVFGASFVVPIVKARVHELLRTQVYRYILLGVVSSIIVSASLLVYYREQVMAET